MNDWCLDLLWVVFYYSCMKSKRERFYAKVNLQGAQPDQTLACYQGLGPCHEWTAGKTQEGYGKHTCDYKTIPAHRFAWELEHGPISEGVLILHKCDNRPCVNTAHLFEGNQKLNALDCRDKGRMRPPSGAAHYSQATPERVARGDAHGTHTQPHRVARHERHGSAKLTMELADEIRSRYASGGCSYRGLAKEFGVSSGTIQPIVEGKTWVRT